MDEVRDCLYFYINLPRKQHQSNDRKGQQPVRIRFLVIQIFQEKNIFLMDEVRDCLYLGKTLRKQTYQSVHTNYQDASSPLHLFTCLHRTYT